MKLCSRCEKVWNESQFKKRKFTCNQCIEIERMKMGDFPFRDFEDLPDDQKEDLSYYTTVNARITFISKKMGIPYSLIMSWRNKGLIPKFEGTIEIEKDHSIVTSYSKWFSSLDLKTQKDVVRYLTKENRRLILDQDLEDPPGLKQKCRQWGISKGKLKIQLYQSRMKLPDDDEFQ